LNRIKEIRQEQHIPQRALAESTGIHRVTIARYESNRVSPSIEHAYRIAQALGVTIDELLRPTEKTA
jgi:putative transcriptional regulator